MPTIPTLLESDTEGPQVSAPTEQLNKTLSQKIKERGAAGIAQGGGLGFKPCYTSP